MYLHDDRENFKYLIEQVAEKSGRTPIVIEKDYYVTLILRLLAEQLDNCVFKGGTSLSKGFHAIERFSEDSYDSVFGFEDERLPQYVKLETALGSYAFPTRVVEIGNYIGDYLEEKSKSDVAATIG